MRFLAVAQQRSLLLDDKIDAKVLEKPGRSKRLNTSNKDQVHTIDSTNHNRSNKNTSSIKDIDSTIHNRSNKNTHNISKLFIESDVLNDSTGIFCLDEDDDDDDDDDHVVQSSPFLPLNSARMDMNTCIITIAASGLNCPSMKGVGLCITPMNSAMNSPLNTDRSSSRSHSQILTSSRNSVILSTLQSALCFDELEMEDGIEDDEDYCVGYSLSEELLLYDS